MKLFFSDFDGTLCFAHNGSNELFKREDGVSMMVHTALEYGIAIYPQGHIQNPIERHC